MKNTSNNTGKTMRTLTLAVTLAALPLAVSLTGCCTHGHREHHGQTEGEYLDDRLISSAVKKELRHDPQFIYPEVRVMTYKGVVQLSGFTNTKDQKSRAGELAKSVQGVKEVENGITVKERGDNPR